jgi:hypothetical protein
MSSAGTLQEYGVQPPFPYLTDENLTTTDENLAIFFGFLLERVSAPAAPAPHGSHKRGGLLLLLAEFGVVESP